MFNSILQVGDQFFEKREHDERGRHQPDPRIQRKRVNISVDDRPLADDKCSKKDTNKNAMKKGSTYSVAPSGAEKQSQDALNAAASASGFQGEGPHDTQPSVMEITQKELAQKKIKQRNQHKRNQTYGGSTSHIERPKDPFSAKFEEIVSTCPANILNKIKMKPLPHGELPQPVYSLATGMGAPYHGYFAKHFKASSKDGNYMGKSERAVADFEYITREEDNQLGRDPCYE